MEESTVIDLVDHIDRLKEEGGNMLIVGDGVPEGHRRVSRQLLSSQSPTTRLIVRTEPEGVCGWLPPADAPGSTHVVTTGPAEVQHDTTVVESELAGTLGQAVARTLEDLLRSDGDRDPGQLHLGFDALGPLFEDHEPNTVFELAYVLTARTRKLGGLGHFHIQVPRDDGHVNLLEPVFDAVVEVRAEDDQFVHRWEFLDQDLKTEWIEI